MVVFEHNSDTCIVMYRSIGGGGGVLVIILCKQCVGQMHKQNYIQNRHNK